ncbi:ABC-F family ATP-binding cassette domain-containing protein [Desulfitobacterium metallireducens]|uniref:Multidrug ABC transporter ATP-binding protein n=1 Tax=Desulfitobacterium metallireducens DSM 15288 TaxID=871968 RepID=W0EC20_9FIRM|nr:ABC-F family ATP-binding cassette domain-containing protein [Desulfitobacterium metallireducens]AHF07083.1 multidrug ABC transporter ATP-binding protein [Desulfitobacterium metallireducens DSM 15288]
MNLLTAENLSKSYGTKVLFSNISFGIQDKEKIGIIGVNGSGKTTLMKILAGLESSEEGKVVKGNDVSLEYLPQDPNFEAEASVLEQVFRGNSSLMQLLRDYEGTLEKLNRDPQNPAYQKKLMDLGQKMDAQNAWQLESEAKTILTKLGITEFETLMGNLSGGQRKRVALASALINPSDLLILDEPTNHIDNETVDWLEQYLNNRKGALIMITHDRYFLDRVANQIFELDRSKLYPYPGNYTRYLELRTEREEQEEASERKRQNRYRSELAWIRRGAQARSTKQKARIERFNALVADKPSEAVGTVDITAGASRLGKKVLECRHLHHEFPSRGTVIEDFSYILARNDRVGIIGPNGRGKSTLLNLLAGRLQPSQGEIEWGPTVKIGFFAQENTEMNPKQRVIDYIKEIAEVLPTGDGGVITASQMLERFLFPPALQWTPIGELSGGEKRRLYLLNILMGAPNVLFLDEPTNDLDIQTLRVLEEYLEEFPGAVMSVSHDRYFLDRVAEKIFAFEGQGKIRTYVGNYSDYQEKSAQEERTESPEIKTGQHDNHPAEESKHRTQKERPLKMTFNEQREFEQIDDLIAQKEDELAKINQAMNGAGSDYSKLNELVSQQQTLEQELEELMERWTFLNELAEQIAQNK